jgi:hypothetical protein|tara:strand:+ start:962 stop:1135 length:174 start_codon:yes stop_codon:yes gene_type:complete
MVDDVIFSIDQISGCELSVTILRRAIVPVMLVAAPLSDEARLIVYAEASNGNTLTSF